MSRSTTSIFLILLLVLVLATNSGCYGPCILTSGVTRWHSDMEANKFVKEAVFIPVFFIVYPITILFDFFILNSIEFWSKSEPETVS